MEISNTMTTMDPVVSANAGVQSAKKKENLQQGNASQGDTVSISEEAIDQMTQAEFEAANSGKIDKLHFGEDGVSLATETMGTTTSQGSSVSVTQTPSRNEAGEKTNSYSMSLTKKNGEALNINFSGNVNVAEGEDGTTSIYFAETNKTQTYGTDGSVTEADGNLLDRNADTLIVNTTSGEVATGDGNDTIFNFADNARISTGAGNDTIHFVESTQGNTVDTGEGDNTVYLKGHNQTVNMGNGNNTVQANGMNGDTITAGDGNNTVVLQNNSSMRNDSSITMGSGDNTVRAYAIRNSEVNLGNGNNTLDVYGVRNSSVEMGDGNNKMNACEVGGYTNLNMGNGNNDFSAYTVDGNAKVKMGDGYNALSTYQLAGKASVSLGDGNNDIAVQEAGDEAQLTAGNGNNTSRIFRMSGNALAQFGSGNNTGTIGQMFDRASFLTKGGMMQNLSLMSGADQSRIFETLTTQQNERQANGLPVASEKFGESNFTINTGMEKADIEQVQNKSVDLLV